MSTLVAERRLVEGPAKMQGGNLIRTDSPARAPRRRTQARGPIARPLRVVPPPSIATHTAAGPRACRGLPASPAPSWRLTDRGVALVLVVALMLTMAALTVIGLTALRVTSPTYEVNVAAPVVAVDAGP